MGTDPSDRRLRGYDATLPWLHPALVQRLPCPTLWFSMAAIKSLSVLRMKKAIIAALTVLAIGIGLDFYARRDAAPTVVTTEVAPTAVVSTPFVGPRSKDDAMRALMDLPELKAWNAHLEKSSGGTTRGALIEYGPTPKVIGDIRYWQISYVENTPDAAHRWESFLVGVDTPDILIDDDETNVPLTLEQWRATKNPIARTSAQ